MNLINTIYRCFYTLFGISDIAKYKINYGSDARFVAGYAVEKDDAIVGLSTVAPNGKIDEFAHFHGYEAVPIIVYDDSLRENKMYEGTINDVLTYWMEKRSFDIGLNYYDSDVPLGREKDFAAGFVKRIGFKPRIGDYDLARHALATSESGWDMNPRCKFDLYNYATVDLNSLLYGFERNMAYFAKKLKKYTDEITWKSRSKERLENMNSYMLNDENIFLDYNFVTGKKSDVFSVASYFAMFTKAANEKQAKTLVDNLSKLEEKYGISTCERQKTNIDYQWDYPNGWACLQYIMIRGLENYGYHDDAVRISKKYVELVERVFAETQNLWEKYNVVEGNINVSREYKMPTMLGWSAGVYIFAKDFLKCTASKAIV